MYTPPPLTIAFYLSLVSLSLSLSIYIYIYIHINRLLSVPRVDFTLISCDGGGGTVSLETCSYAPAKVCVFVCEQRYYYYIRIHNTTDALYSIIHVYALNNKYE